MNEKQKNQRNKFLLDRKEIIKKKQRTKNVEGRKQTKCIEKKAHNKFTLK